MMSGVTISEVYQKARHRLLAVRDGLERLERLESTTLGSTSTSFSTTSDANSQDDLAQNVKRGLAQLQQYTVEMDQMWRIQIAKPHSDLWKRKVEQIAEEADQLRKGLDKYLMRQNRRQLEAKERAELFQRMKGNGSEGAQIIQVHDEEMQALHSVRNSTRMLEEAHATGAAVLLKYAEQRERIKNAQRKALDIINTVGLSNSLLKLIERRHKVDKWIAYFGMLLVVVIVVGVWYWLR